MTAERYWEGRWRDEAKNNDVLRRLLVDMLNHSRCDMPGCRTCETVRKELGLSLRDARDVPFDPGPEAA